MSLKASLTQASIQALKSGQKDRLGVVRLILASVQQKEIEQRAPLEDTQVVAVLDKMVKQRQDSITQYEQAQRMDLAAQEKFELSVIDEFRPSKMSQEATQKIIDQVLVQTGANGLSSLGAVMGALKPLLAGQADMGWVSKRVKEMLSV